MTVIIAEFIVECYTVLATVVTDMHTQNSDICLSKEVKALIRDVLFKRAE